MCVDYHPEDVYTSFYDFVTGYDCNQDHNGNIRDILAVFGTVECQDVKNYKWRLKLT